MHKTTIGFGSFLILLGLGGYLGSGRASKTALIPAPIGALLLALGFVAGNRRHRTPALIAAAGVAGIGLVGAADGLPKLVRLLAGQEVARPQAVVAKAAMALSCGAYVLLCIRAIVAQLSREAWP